MNYESFYKETYRYLLEKAKNHNIDEQKLEKYFTPQKGNGKLFECYNSTTLQNLLFRFAFHAQNGGQISKVIKFPVNASTPRRKIFEKIFCNFDPRELLSTYKTVDNLFDTFISELEMPKLSHASKTLNHKRGMPYKYCKSIFSAAKLLSEFATYSDFTDKLQTMGDMAPIYISLEVYGFDIALSCDFIKELGLVGQDLPKPDTHIVGVLFDLGLIDKSNGIEANYRSIKVIKEMTEAIKKIAPECTAYKLDKMLWLVCTETFYDDDNKSNSGDTKRKEYLKHIKSFI